MELNVPTLCSQQVSIGAKPESGESSFHQKAQHYILQDSVCSAAVRTSHTTQINPAHSHTSICTLHFNINFMFSWRDSPQWALASSFIRFSKTQTMTHHNRQDSSGRVISSLQRPLPDNTQHSQQTNIHAHPPVRFEPTISAGERPQTYALDRAATGTGTVTLILNIKCSNSTTNFKSRKSPIYKWVRFLDPVSKVDMFMCHHCCYHHSHTQQ